MQLIMICHHSLIQKKVYTWDLRFCIFQMNAGRAKRNGIVHFCKQNITINRSHLIHSLILATFSPGDARYTSYRYPIY